MLPLPRTVAPFELEGAFSAVPVPDAADPRGTVAAWPRVALLAAADSEMRGAPTPLAAATLTDSAAALAAAPPACALLRVRLAAPPLEGAAFEGVPTPAARSGRTLAMLVLDVDAGLFFAARSAGIPADC